MRFKTWTKELGATIGHSLIVLSMLYGFYYLTN